VSHSLRTLRGHAYDTEVTWRCYRGILDASEPLHRAIAVTRGVERYLATVSHTSVLVQHARERARDIVTLLEGISDERKKETA